MSQKKLGEDLRGVVDSIADKYFIDPTEEVVGEKTVSHWNILMGVFSYIGRKNVLLEGNRGTGKTTFASVISSYLSGLPFDLFNFEKIQGHPEQTKDTMLARLDLARLAEEGVVWQPSIYLPALTIDEINRLPPGKQSILLEFVRTGGVEHFGKYFYREKKPTFFATKNYADTGTYPIPTPQLDRFNISLEFTPSKAYLQKYVSEAERNIKKDLINPEVTKEIIETLLTKDMRPEDKLDYIEERAKELREEKNIPDLEINDEMLDELYYTPDARTFINCMWEEINTTKLYGTNRLSDPQDTSTHNQPFASSVVKEGISFRAYNSTWYYAGLLSLCLGDEKVGIEHVQAVAPYVLAHRLEFTEDYKAKFAEKERERNEREEMALTRELVKSIKDNYDKVANPLKLLDNYLATNPGKEDENVEKILKGPEPDHPLLNSYWNEVRKIYKNSH